MKNFIKLWSLLFILWLLLSGQFNRTFILLGLGCAFAVALVCHRFLYFEGEEKRHFIFEVGILPLSGYLLWLVKEIAISSFQVMRIVSRRHIDIQPQIVTFEWKVDSPVAKAVLINSITLTPGTLSISEENDVYTVHALTEEAKKSLLTMEMQNRIEALFEK